MAKTNLQISEVSISSTVASYGSVGTLRTISNIYAKGGLIGLWSPGLKTTCIREISSVPKNLRFFQHQKKITLVFKQLPTLKRKLLHPISILIADKKP